MRGIVGFGLVVLLSSAAFASPLKIRNGSTVRVSLKGKRESGIGLHPKNGTWRVELGGSKETADETVDLVDVTDGANNTKWQLAPTEGALTLDSERFIAGHAYRVTVMRGLEPVASALIYLYPPTMTGKSKVSFDDSETGGGGAASDDVAIVKKPSL
jgi:hypothetical protein